MISAILAKIIGSRNDRELKKLYPIVQRINAFEPEISALSDDQLSKKTIEFKEQLAHGKTLDDVLPEAFAVVREASKRKLGQRHYDVQLMGGIVLHQGKIPEMKTGEGKTLTAILALYLNALSGNSSFLVTVNDYLVRRDAAWMEPVFNMLGMSVGIVQHSLSDEDRKKAYQCDVVYATNNELGFDYLRDNMKFRLEDYVQRDLSFAIVDEVDSILIDEARTPLIISGASGESSELYFSANKAVSQLKKGEDYEVDEKQRSVQLTESGNDKVEAFFKIKNLYAIEHLSLLHHVTQALRAHALFHKDVEYVVQDNQVLIVDEFTGRILAGRRYSDGLHQALEAKEGVELERETQTLASITLQNLFRLFKKLAGMTGTAMTEAEEFFNIYKLDVVSIPTNKKMVRDDKNDLIFLSEAAKYRAIVEDVKERFKKGQPVLIGTIAVEKSEALSNVLRKEGIPHDVLNAKQHEREADIVACAGQPGKITIATNMAGRGTDIKLTPDSLAAGGLYILGTERHESRRIDNQLRGRAGRQGDAGESRFYISLEDQLIRVFAGDTFQFRDQMQRWAGMTDDETIESPMVSRAIENSQEKVEKQHFESRKHLLEYDDVMTQHRKVIYSYRSDVLQGAELIYELVRDMITAAVEDVFLRLVPERVVTAEQEDEVVTFLSRVTFLDKKVFLSQKFNTSNSDIFQSDVINFLLEQYRLSHGSYNQELRTNAEKWMMLETLDQAWKQHMLNLDHLKEGISLRSWGQKNPLIEYKKEAFAMFTDMMREVRWEVISRIFSLNLEHFDTSELERKRENELDALTLTSGGEDKEDSSSPSVRQEPRIGRNDDCPCGSGKKYKKCCG